MKEVYVFGRGKRFLENEEIIQKNYSVLGFLDNSVKDKEYDCERDTFIYSPNDVNELKEINILIVSQYFIEMWKQLKNLGVDNSRIEFYGSPVVNCENDILYIENKGNKFYFGCQDEYIVAFREWSLAKNKDIRSILSLNTEPVSRAFGLEYGTPVDRYYIEHFLEKNKQYICGTVMEMGDDKYTVKFGRDKVKKSIVSHVYGWNDLYLCNFETGEGVKEDMVDCIICTQTLQYIYDCKAAIMNIFKMLKENGTALITVPGIKSLSTYDDNNWGEKWSFTEKSMLELCKEVAGEENISVSSFGNVKTTVAYLYGICGEFLDDSDFVMNDSQFPFVVTAVLKK